MSGKSVWISWPDHCSSSFSSGRYMKKNTRPTPPEESAMATATLHFVEITLRFEPNTSSFSILASEDPHATHKAEFTASSVDRSPDQLLKDLLQRVIEIYPDPQGHGIEVQVTR